MLNRTSVIPMVSSHGVRSQRIPADLVFDFDFLNRGEQDSSRAIPSENPDILPDFLMNSTSVAYLNNALPAQTMSNF
jgi:hypothetical protein